MRRKFGKSVLALFLAGVMTFTTAGEAVAAGNIVNDAIEMSTETENDENVAETVSESETAETKEDETVVPEGETTLETENAVEDETTAETEGTSEDETVTETESASEIETETEVETETIPETEESTTEIETEIETEDETETAEEIETVEEETSALPGLKNYSLSEDQRESKRQLNEHLSQLRDLREGQDYIAGELVFLAETEEEAKEIAAAYGAVLSSFAYGVGVIELPKEIGVMQALETAAASADAADRGEGVVIPPAWPNYIYKANTDRRGVTGVTVVGSETTDYDAASVDTASYTAAANNFNDPMLSAASDMYQWQHQMVGSVYAWNAGYTGKNINIAILDSGVYAHADLNVIGNYNFTTDADAADGDGHGTHVAGLAAAKKGNGIGGAGIAPDANIINMKVLDTNGGETGTGDSASVLRGMRAAVPGKSYSISEKVDIVNMSLGGPSYAQNEADVMKELYDAGIAVFVAAGNDGSKIKAYPAGYDGAICVGAVQENGGRTYFSNYGSWVKFSAPGYTLYSTSNTGDFEAMSGTSQATPVVSGTAAVILSADESIQKLSGRDKVDALIKKMNSGKISGNGGAAGIVSLTKVFKLSTMTAAPGAPEFVTKSQTVTGADQITVTLKAKSEADTIYYSVDGKNPTYKNGVLSANARIYDKSAGVLVNEGRASVTVKAIAVNACGKTSKVVSATYKFKPNVREIQITGDDVLLKGKNTTLKATVVPSYAAAKKVEWKSLSPELSVTASGKVTVNASAAAGQTYTIQATAKDNGKVTATFDITVQDAAKVKKVEFKDADGKAKKKDTVNLGKNELFYDLSSYLKVTLIGESEGQLSDVKWSTNNSKIAEVGNSGIDAGKVTIKEAGTVKITATAKDGSRQKAEFTLTVKQMATSLKITGTDKIAFGKSVKMTATITPSNTASKKVEWAVKESGKGVTVNAKNGTVSVAKTATAGTYTITATIKNGEEILASDEKKIEVSNNAIESITLKDSENETVKNTTIFRVSGGYYGLEKGVPTSITLTADAKGSDAVEFTSSNPGIATVRQNGTTAVVEATGKAAGTVKITCAATDGSKKKAVCTIKVANPMSSLAVVPQGGNDGYVAVGKKIKLSAVIGEDYGSVASKKVTWESLDPTTATVDRNGTVKGVKPGRVAIRATLQDGSNLGKTYLVFVTKAFKELKLAGFREDTGRIKWTNQIKAGNGGYFPVLYDDDTYASVPTVCPDVAIEIDNSDILWADWEVYDDEGRPMYGYIRIFAKKAGITTITIKAMDGSNVKKTYRVEVLP